MVESLSHDPSPRRRTAFGRCFMQSGFDGFHRSRAGLRGALPQDFFPRVHVQHGCFRMMSRVEQWHSAMDCMFDDLGSLARFP